MADSGKIDDAEIAYLKRIKKNAKRTSPAELAASRRLSKRDWQIAELLADSNRLFALWLVSRGTCVTRADFTANYKGLDFDPLVGELIADGFLAETTPGLIRVTSLGRTALRSLGNEDEHAPRESKPAAAQAATPRIKLEQLESQIDECFTLAKSIDPENLDDVLKLLRKARNVVASKQSP